MSPARESRRNPILPAVSSIDESPGVFTFMVGLIVVVMGGVGLSLVVDQRFSFSRGAVRLEREVEADSKNLERLRVICRESAGELSEIEPPRRRMTDAYEATRSELQSLARRRAVLSAELAALRKSVSTIDQEFSLYRRKYRGATWAAAAGESLGDLKVRGGRVYHQAVITRVTDVGLEIRHEHGIARVHAPDLDSGLQDRFQWHDEERELRLKEEIVRRDAGGVSQGDRMMSVSREGEGAPRGIGRSVVAPDPEKLESLRGKVRAWKTKVARLNAERSAALAAASYGSQTSVPGSLETWQARAVRLGVELAKAQAEFAAAKAELARIAPDDPLLRPERRRN